MLPDGDHIDQENDKRGESYNGREIIIYAKRCWRASKLR